MHLIAFLVSDIEDYNPCVWKSACVNGDCEFIMENQTTTCKCFPG